MKITVLAAAAAALAVAGYSSVASAQDQRLGAVWQETEGAWSGTWTPTNPDLRNGAYTAVFHQTNERADATLQIRVLGNLATILRTQPNGQHCTYRGTFNADHNIVSGTYTCDWHRDPLPWTAQIGALSPAASTDRAPSLTTPRLLLAFPWSETEGRWRGTWTPVAPRSTDGHFSATFLKPADTSVDLRATPERAIADLQISITGGTSPMVSVRRSDPNGRTCTYTGQVDANFTNITGGYICSDNRSLRLPWSARVQVPAPRP